MIGKIARGAYVLIVGTMIVAWVISLQKQVPPEKPKPGPHVWRMYS
ncbi:MAG TPA: hypothetical protein VFB29_14255 [Pseudolabrys sp.]|nr:hypothetical protein [Pseudolabrys sp.]